MNAKKYIYLKYSIMAVVVLALFVYLQMTGKYLFYYLEQQQMFLFEGRYMANLLMHVGGLGKFVAYFAAQFFVLPYVGALVMTLLLLIISHAFYRVFITLADGALVWCLAWLTPLLLLFFQFQTDYFLQGTVAYAFMALALWGYTCLPERTWRFVVGGVGTVAFFLLFGSVALPLFISAAVWELLKRRSKCLFSLTYIFLALLVGFFAVYFSWVGDYQLAYTPTFYYDAVSEMPSEFYALYVVPPLLLILCAVFGLTKKENQKKLRISLIIMQIILLVWLAVTLREKYVKRDIMPTMELDYYVWNKQWDNVLAFYERHPGNYLYLNCYNMALAQQNRLGDNLFSVQQAGPYSLHVGENTTELVASLLSEIDLSIGDVQGAQKMAFTSCIASKSAVNPHQLVRMVKTHLAQKEYKVAEKYLLQLSHTLFYNDFALQYNRYARQPRLIADDAELMTLRRSLQGTNHLVTPTSLKENLQSIVQADSTNQRALSYLGAYYLLGKDLDGFRQFVQHYYGGTGTPALPRNFQEGLCAAVPNNVPFWRTYGVSDEVTRQFSDYGRILTENKGNPALAQLMQSQFGQTFWYYYMFVK